MKALARAAAAVVGAIDAQDLCGALGLALIGAGLGLVSVPAALVVSGVVLLGIALFPAVAAVILQTRR